MNLAALVVVPFAAWHTYRAIRSLRTGVFQSLGDAIDRASSPTIFWFRVARELLLGALFTAVFLSTLASLGQKTVVGLFAAYAVVYASLLVVTSLPRDP